MGPTVTAVGGKNMVVVRDMSQTMILRWDFFLAHKARVDAGRQLFVFDGKETLLLTREQVVLAPTLVRAREKVDSR